MTALPGCQFCPEPILPAESVAISRDGLLCHHECLIEALRQSELISASDARDYHDARGDA